MKSLERSLDKLFFTCDKCGRIREPVEFDDVPEKHKEDVKKMMDAMNPVLMEDDGIAAFIVFCKKCDEYSVVLMGGGGEWR